VLILTCSVLVLSTTVPAQTARQGTEKADPTEFHSPMVLEVEFLAAKPSLWQAADSDTWVQGAEYGNLSKYHCDGVAIRSLQLSPTKIPGDRVETRIRVSVMNTGHDKQVKLLFELFNGDIRVADGVLGPFKDKEGATVNALGSIAALRADLSTDPITTLRITMTNWDY